MAAASSKQIFLSAGHSMTDPGALSSDGKYKEADLAMKLRDALADELETRGLKALRDNIKAGNDELRDAIVTAKLNAGGINLEFHFNAGPAGASGIEILSLPSHKALAQKLAYAINLSTGAPIRGEAGWKDQSSGQHHRLGFCQAGGLIVEVCFISNNVDLAHYLNHFQQVVGNLASVLDVEARGLKVN